MQLSCVCGEIKRAEEWKHFLHIAKMITRQLMRANFFLLGKGAGITKSFQFHEDFTFRNIWFYFLNFEIFDFDFF